MRDVESDHDKVQDYLAAGCQMVWVLWPRRQAVSVHSADESRALGPDAFLDGGDLLPGFRVRVGDLFAVRRTRRR